MCSTCIRTVDGVAERRHPRVPRRDFVRTLAAAAVAVCVPDVLWAANGGKAPAVRQNGEKRVSVRDFGAAGDGATNDSSAFQKAATAAADGVVVVPPGRYVISGAVSLPSNIVIAGTGQDSVIIGNVEQYLRASQQNNITLQGLQFLNPTSARLLFSACTAIRILNCRFNGKMTDAEWYLGGMAVRFNGCRHVAVLDSEFIDYNNAIYFDKHEQKNSDVATVKGCRFSHTGKGRKWSYPAQVYQFNCDDLTVDDCTFLDILPGDTGVAGRQSYSVYEGDGTAEETIVKNCRDIITQRGVAGLHTGIFTSQNARTTISNSTFEFDPASNGRAFKNGGRTLVSFVKNTCAGAVFMAAPPSATCAFIVENNVFKDISLGRGGPAVRIGANNRKTSKGTIRANQIMDVQGGGIVIDLCDHAAVAENRIVNVNTLNTKYNGSNDWQVSGISFRGAHKGLVSRNHIENTPGGSGHAKFAISIGTRRHEIDIRPDNVSLGMETKAIVVGGSI